MRGVLRTGLLAVFLTTLYSCVSVYADTVDYSVEYTGLTSIDTSARGYTASYAGQLAGCKSLGGVPVALGTPNRDDAVRVLTRDMSPRPKFFYIGATAEPTSPSAGCVEAKNGAECVYRFMFGFNSRDTANGQPGSGFFKDTKILSAESGSAYAKHVINYYKVAQSNWNYPPLGSKLVPRGYFYLIYIFYEQKPTLFAWLDSTAVNNVSITLMSGGYALVCEMQKLMDTMTTTMIKQPQFRQTWKTLTWAQTYWWVIFLIVGVIILAILLFIVVYCCYTRKEAPPGQPVHSMVVRESNGQLTNINSSKTYDESTIYDENINVNPLQGPQDVDEMQQPVSVYSAGEGAMVYGDSDIHNMNI